MSTSHPYIRRIMLRYTPKGTHKRAILCIDHHSLSDLRSIQYKQQQQQQQQKSTPNDNKLRWQLNS